MARAATKRTGVERPQYRAPALEKGLDVLELLAVEQDPLTVTEIVQRLGRSTGELFRMILVLEQRGFLVQTERGYVLSTRLFQLGLSRPPAQNLVEAALPLMRELSVETHQSCHLVFASQGDMVVVARMESRDQLGFSVRVGYRRPLFLTGSGTTLYAFQPGDVRAEWEAMFAPAPARAALAEFRARADTVAAAGYARQPSAFVEGVIDLSAPILRGGSAAAALGIPYVRRRGAEDGEEAAIAALRRVAGRIGEALALGDSGV